MNKRTILADWLSYSEELLSFMPRARDGYQVCFPFYCSIKSKFQCVGPNTFTKKQRLTISHCFSPYSIHPSGDALRGGDRRCSVYTMCCGHGQTRASGVAAQVSFHGVCALNYDCVVYYVVFGKADA